MTANKHCAVIKKATKTWLSIDLKTVKEIERVVIAGRKEDPTHSGNFKIMCAVTFDSTKWSSNVFSTCLLQDNALGPEEVTHAKCQDKCIGQFIVVEKTKNAATEYLQICELEAYEPDAYWNVALGKEAIHHTRAAAAVVTDGLPDQAKCTTADLTDSSDDQWIRIDLERQRGVVSITMIVPSKATDAKRLSTYKLIVSNSASDPELEDPSTVCGEKTNIPAGTKTITAHCPREIVGRYVYLLKENAVYNPPVVCEIEVIGYDLQYSERDDLASCKPTFMIDNSPDAKYGVDGNLHQTCLATSGTSNNDWWAVDLGALYTITAINVVNIDDATYKFLGKFKILASTDLITTDIMKSNYMQCHEQKTEIARNHGRRIHCAARVYGRYVILVKTLKEKLQFCHVGVFGSRYLDNLALGKATSHSATLSDYKSHLAVDGKWDWELRYRSCALTTAAANSWFQVDLSASYNVSAVSIQSNLKECGTACLVKNDFKILVGATFKTPIDPTKFTTCYTHTKQPSLAAGDYQVTNTFYCTKESVGRHVVIQSSAAISLTICELGVYGFYMYDNLAFGKKGISASGYKSVWDLRYTHDGSRSCLANVAAIDGSAANAEWWYADLVKAHNIRRVLITQPENKWKKKSTLEINVLKKKADFVTTKPLKTVSNTCGMYKDYGPATQDILCSRVHSGALVLLLRRDHRRQTLWLCEVEIYGTLAQDNLAAYKTSVQSNELTTALTYGNGVDGVSGTALAHCSNTAGVLQREWFAVDLTGNYTIEKVVLLNSKGRFNRSLADTKVLAYNDFSPKSYEEQSYFLCTEVDQHLQPGEDKQFGCNPYVTGRFVVLMKFNAIDSPFSICELEVYGKAYVESRVDAKHPWASVYMSNRLPSPYPCGYTTGVQKVEWYAVDLFTFWTVHSVVFTTRGGTYGKKITSDLHILTLDEFQPDDMNDIYPGSFTGTGTKRSTPITHNTCIKQTFTLMVGEDRQMNCAANVTGRFLVIAKTNAISNSLQLCDLKVFATKIPIPPGGATGSPTPPPTTTTTAPPKPQPEKTQPPPEPESGSGSLGAIIGAVVGLLVIGGGAGAAVFVMKKKQLGPFANKGAAKTINVKPNNSGDQQSIVESVDDRPRSVSSVKTIVPGQDGAAGVP
ncbi:uncharacterized protein LOC135498331 [Lineus longissimus]|uniref:uncharacterized protein LOC135498331 n=1 Tax=Lineus longissimus TaxID=88925 RepID=UPI00315DDC7A